MIHSSVLPHTAEERDRTHVTKVFGVGYGNDGDLFPLHWQCINLPRGIEEGEEGEIPFGCGVIDRRVRLRGGVSTPLEC